LSGRKLGRLSGNSKYQGPRRIAGGRSRKRNLLPPRVKGCNKQKEFEQGMDEDLRRKGRQGGCKKKKNKQWQKPTTASSRVVGTHVPMALSVSAGQQFVQGGVGGCKKVLRSSKGYQPAFLFKELSLGYARGEKWQKEAIPSRIGNKGVRHSRKNPKRGKAAGKEKKLKKSCNHANGIRSA